MYKKKEIIIISDYGYINGGAARVAVKSALDLSESEDYKVTFVCVQIDNQSRLAFRKSNIDVIVADVGSSMILGKVISYIFNFKAYRSMKDLSSRFSDDASFHVHTYVNELSASIFLALSRNGIKNVYLTAHDYFTICPNGAHFNFQKCNPCSLSGGSIGCFITQCDKRSLFEGVLRKIRFAVEKLIFSFGQPTIFSISKLSQKKLGQYGYKTDILLNNIDFEPTKNITPFHERNGLLYIGRLDEEKGFFELMNFCIVNEIKLRVVGDPEGKNLPKSEFIEFLGWCEREEIVDYLRKSLSLVMPSLWFESFGLVPMEAAACGTPSIISSRCGVVDYFPNDYELIMEPENIESVQEYYTNLMDKDYWDECSRSAVSALLNYRDRMNNNKGYPYL